MQLSILADCHAEPLAQEFQSERQTQTAQSAPSFTLQI